MDKRGVYFFVLDAFLGAIIIVVSLVVILNSYSEGDPGRQPLTIMEDFLSYIQNTQVRDFRGNYTQTLIKQGNITDPTVTLFEQIAIFYAHNQTQLAENFTREIVVSSVPSQFNFQFKYDGNVTYEQKITPREEAPLSLATRKISMVNVNRTLVYGPKLVEVYLWTT